MEKDQIVLKKETRRRLKSLLAKSGRNAVNSSACLSVNASFATYKTKKKKKRRDKSVLGPFSSPPLKTPFLKGVLWCFFVFRSQLFPRFPYPLSSNPPKKQIPSKNAPAKKKTPQPSSPFSV